MLAFGNRDIDGKCSHWPAAPGSECSPPSGSTQSIHSFCVQRANKSEHHSPQAALPTTSAIVFGVNRQSPLAQWPNHCSLPAASHSHAPPFVDHGCPPFMLKSLLGVTPTYHILLAPQVTWVYIAMVFSWWAQVDLANPTGPPLHAFVKGAADPTAIKYRMYSCQGL